MSRLPRLVSVCSGLYILFVAGWFLTTASATGLRAGSVFDLVLLLIPGLTVLYAGLRLPRLGIAPGQYPTLLWWVAAGIGAMIVFLLLRVLHPGVDADWTVGTQAIAFTIGSVGGLLIGLQQTRAISRAEQLERRSHQLRRRNAELAARKRELAHQNRRLDRFTGVVSHDLRSPLSATVGWIEMAKRDCDSAYLAEATHGLNRMGAIIDNTLELARQGQTVVSVDPVGFRTLVTDCWRLTTTTDEGLPTNADERLTIHGEATICGDADRLRHLFENLFRNCLDHAGSGVSVTAGVLGDDGVYVEDDGPGIPAAYREVLFQPGYTTLEGGTGFGLAIVAEIADAHGWTIRVTDSDRGGARFELTGIAFRTAPPEDDPDRTLTRDNYSKA